MIFRNAFNILKDVADLVFFKDLQGVYRAVNPRFAEVIGLSQEELVGKTVFDIDEHEFAEARKREDELAISEGESVSEITRFDRIFSVKKTPFRNDDGEVIGILSIGRDITDLKREQEKTKKSEIIFRMVLDTAPEAIFWKDTDSTYIGGNRAFAKTCRLSTEEIAGKTDRDMPWSEYADRVRESDRKIIEQKSPRFDHIDTYIDAETKEKRWVKTSKVPIIVNGHGIVAGLLGTYKDITQEVEDRSTLEQYAIELELTNKELEQFAHIASHDLKTPLRLIHMKLDFIEEELVKVEDDTSSIQKLMNETHELANRMTKMINGLLDYSHVAKKVTNKKSIDLNGILEDIVRIFPNNNMKIAIGELPQIDGDESQIYRLFQNILENSNKFRDPEKEESILCIYQCEETDDENTICIEDNGIGMPSGSEEESFNIFQSLHSKKQGAGEGIGLAICKKIVESHGGKIWITSQEGIGTKVFISLKKFQEPIDLSHSM